MSTAARMNINALVKLGIRVTDVSPRIISEPVCDVGYHHVNPGDRPFKPVGAKNVAYWTWEIDDYLPAAWLDASAEFDQLWVPSDFCAKGLISGGVDPMKVKVVPHYHTVTNLPATASRPFEFLVMFDGRSRIERKNPWAAIRAFRRAFPGKPDVKMTIKAHGLGLDAQRTLAEETGGDPRITLVEGYMNEHALYQFMGAFHAYVSLHRSEGFGLNILNAMALGVPTIVTPHGGNEDFCTETTSYPVKFARTGVKDFYYRSGTWAEPDIEHAASLMRSLVFSSQDTKGRIANAYKLVNTSYTLDVTANAIKTALSTL
jgi:glycosyltransferase involved in cell wall biosynthesis